MFFDKTCIIYKTSYSKVGGSVKMIYTPKYNNVICNYELVKGQARTVNTAIADNTDLPIYVVVIPLMYSDFSEGDHITLFDPTLCNQGQYLIGNIQASKSISGFIDCVTFYVYPIKGQK